MQMTKNSCWSNIIYFVKNILINCIIPKYWKKNFFNLCRTEIALLNGQNSEKVTGKMLL